MNSEHLKKFLYFLGRICYSVESGEDSEVLPDLEVRGEVGVGRAEIGAF